MKKTLVALAVLATASANAGNLYENDATSVKVSGEVDTVIKTSEYNNGSVKVVDNDPQVYAWANVQFDIDHKLSDSVTAFGSFEMEADNGESVAVDDAKIGFKGNFGKVTFGETGSSYAVLEKGELTNEGDDVDVVYNSSESDGHGIRYEVTVAESLDLSFDMQTNKAQNADNDWALSADYAIGDFTIGAAYIQADEKAVDYDRSAMGLSVSYEANGFYVAATYTDYEGQGAVNVNGGEDTFKLADHDGNTYALAASYSWDAYKVYTAYQVLSADQSTAGAAIDADLDNFYVQAESRFLDVN